MNIRNIGNTGLIVTYIDASRSVKIVTDLGNYLEKEIEDLTQILLLMPATETVQALRILTTSFSELHLKFNTPNIKVALFAHISYSGGSEIYSRLS
jgi:hypothetical protein